MPTKDSFAGLEGFFKDPNSRQFYTIPPEEHQRIVECNHLREYFGNRLANHSYTPEDVVGVAFGTTHEGEGVQLRQIYFTQRGLKEQEKPALKEGYKALCKQAIVKSNGVLLPLFERKGFQSLADRFANNPIEFHNLSGPDGKNRVLIVYSCNIRDYSA